MHHHILVTSLIKVRPPVPAIPLNTKTAESANKQDRSKQQLSIKFLFIFHCLNVCLLLWYWYLVLVYLSAAIDTIDHCALLRFCHPSLECANWCYLSLLLTWQINTSPSKWSLHYQTGAYSSLEFHRGRLWVRNCFLCIQIFDMSD